MKKLPQETEFALLALSAFVVLLVAFTLMVFRGG
jgi:hypothetical protein